MSVYIITARDHGVCKIGFSANPISRLASLQTSIFVDLKIEAVIPADQSNEIALHITHSKSRTRGEWFKISPEIEKLIAQFPCDFEPRKNRLVNEWDEPEALTYGAPLYREIRDFCLHRKVAAATFGRQSINDWKLVDQIKNGRDLRLSTVHKIRTFMDAYSLGLAK